MQSNIKFRDYPQGNDSSEYIITQRARIFDN